MEHRQATQITTGLILIAVGLIMLGDRFDVLAVDGFRRLWPVFVIIAGLVRLTVPRADGSRGGLGLLLVGGIFLLHTCRVLPIRQSWPLFIVAAGLSILMGQMRRPAPPAGADHPRGGEVQQ